MAHFAKINDENIVVEVLVVDNSLEHRGADFLANDLGLGGNWIQTSYNTRGNQHPEGRPLHKNYAAIGFHWDGIGFFEPQPYPSWSKNEKTYLWESPVPFPTDGKSYSWDESSLSWIEVKI